jgi:L-alanine-DL-glutamate epimerase-like enolase superfamily enzyme
MRVVDCTTFVIANPPPHFGGRYFIVVKLTTDTGVVGYGEVYVATFGPHAVAAMVADLADRWVIDADPNRIELLWRRMYSSGYSLRPDPTLVGVMSGVEMACWDIVGKDAGKPVYDLLGGRVHDRIRTYTYLYPADGRPDVYTDPTQAAEQAAFEVERGFTAVKFDPAGPYTAFDGHQPSLEDIERSVAITGAIREAVGSRADLLFGTHGQFTAAGAIRLAQRLEAFDPLWFEEPTQPDQPEEMARVARQTSIPIATGERLTTITSSQRSPVTRRGDLAAEPGAVRRAAGGEEDRGDRRGGRLSDRTAPVLRPDPRRGEHPAGGDAAEPPDRRGHPGLGWLPRRAADHPHPVGGRPRDPVERARPRRRTERARGTGQPLPHRRRTPPDDERDARDVTSGSRGTSRRRAWGAGRGGRRRC